LAYVDIKRAGFMRRTNLNGSETSQPIMSTKGVKVSIGRSKTIPRAIKTTNERTIAANLVVGDFMRRDEFMLYSPLT
jgi:hypothetical protein